MTRQPTFRPLAPIFGVEAVGLDLREALDESVAETLRNAWHEHALILFREQNLSDADVDRVAAVFGTITDDDGYYQGDRGYVSNVLPKGLSQAGELTFHMDMSFWDDPLRGIALYAIEVPPEGSGGDTMFANVKLAYESLPETLRLGVQDLEVVHTTAHANPAIVPPKEATHPIPFPHPVTGETVLYCNPHHFDRIVGMEAGQGQALFAELASYINQPEIVYTHAWRPGDFVVWDNIKLQHARTYFDPKHRRHLRRVQIAAPLAVPA